MSLQWTFVATFLYAEILCVVLLLLPWVSPQRWKKILTSRLLNSIAANSHVVFVAIICVLALLFLDAIREMRKYQDPVHSHPDMKNNPGAEMMMHMKLFRAQRNFYISGFALFLWFVLRRLVTLLVNNASLEASYEAAMKQAASASSMAKELLENQDSQENKDNEQNKSKEGASSTKEITALKASLERALEAETKAKEDLKAMKQQAESVSTEYDRLMVEHEKLQKELSVSDKKDD